MSSGSSSEDEGSYDVNESRRREDENDDSDDDREEDQREDGPNDDRSDDNNKEDHEKDSDDNDDEESDKKKSKKKKKVHRLSLTETENFNEKLKKRGVIYIARIPPKLTPTKIKSLLSEFCEVTRIYLVEEDATVRKRRKKEYGRSGGKRYVEGWVEMSNKKKAKRIALQLNNTPISNHKRNPHYGKRQGTEESKKRDDANERQL